MTLKASASLIEICNASGQIKFTSEDKLLYKVQSQTGTISVGSSRVIVPFVEIGLKQFLRLNIVLNSGTGYTNLINPIIGVEQPAHRPIFVDFQGRLNGYNEPIADSEILMCALVGPNLEFKTLRYRDDRSITSGITTNNLTYKATVYSYV